VLTGTPCALGASERPNDRFDPSMASRRRTLRVVQFRIGAFVAALLIVAGGCGASPSNAPSVDGETARESEVPTSTSGEDARPEPDEATASGEPTTTVEPVEEPGDDWPHSFGGSLIGGGQIDANDLAGSDLVLWFWAPW